MIGQTISHYQILAKLGEGGMGVVYKAADLKLKRPVALKFLPFDLTRDQSAKERFVQEAQAASLLDHPNICNIHEIGETDDGQIFIVMAYYEGETLQKKVDSGPLSVDSAIGIAVQIAQGLAKAHAHGIVHRDLKPANVIITKEGVAKILDFGLAKLTGQQRLTKTGSTVGTMAYMSPEQARGEEVDHRTDVWALGVVLYEMLTGKLPFNGEYEHAVMYGVLHRTPTAVTHHRAEVPVALDSLVLKTMEKRPGERYQSAEEMFFDLKRLLREEPQWSSRSFKIARLFRKPSTNYFVAAGAALLLILASLWLKLVFFESEVIAVPKPIAVISFENQTGDSTYNYLQKAIPSLLITSLEQSPYLQVTTWERMHDLLKQLGKDKVETIDSDLGFELCRMDGVEVIVLGSIVKAGKVFATNVRVLDVNTKKILKSASAKGEGVASILNTQIDALSGEISRGAGLTERKLEAAQVPIAEVTTSSMEAYQFYIGAREYADRYYEQDAIRLLEKAIEKDSTFASAYLLLSGLYGGWRDPSKSVSMLKKAKQYSQRASEKERLSIEAAYAGRLERNSQKADSLLEQIVLKYPKEARAHGPLAGRYMQRREYKKAIEQFNKLLTLNPNSAAAYNTLAYAYANQGEFDKAVTSVQHAITLSPGSANPLDTMAEIYISMGQIDVAIAKFKEVQAIKPDFPGVDWRLAYCYALQENYTEASKTLDHHAAMYPGEVFCYAMRGFYHYFQGKIKQACADLQQAEARAGSLGNDWPVRETKRLQAWLAYDLGAFEDGRRAMAKFISLLMEAHPEGTAFHRAYNSFYCGLISLRLGQIDSAKYHLQVVKSILPQAESEGEERARFQYEMLSAEILLAEGSARDALAVIQKMSYPRLQLWMNAYETFAYNLPFRDDLAARACLNLGDWEGAIAQYERLTIIDPQSPDRRLIPARIQFKLAKLYEQKGQASQAISRYEHFLNVWKNAEEGLLEVNEAKVRLAALKRVVNK